MFSLFRLPLVAFRPHDLLFVYESDRHVAGLVRVERENWRDDWTIVELDAIGGSGPGEIRYRLVQQILREGQKRGAVRFHVACTDADDNVELFMQAGFVRYGEERVLYRPPDQPLPKPWTDERAAAARIRQARPIDATALMQLYAAVTPPPVQRLEAFRIPDWERQGSNWRVPRSSLAPILRFADLDGFVQESPGRRAPRCVHPDGRRARGPAALPAPARPARGRPPAAHRVRARHDRGRSPSEPAAAGRITACSRPCEPTSHRPTGGSRSRASPRSRRSRCS